LKDVVKYGGYKSHIKAVKKFPSVRDCMKSSEQKKPQPDLTQIDWEEITSDAEVNVCLFRIASSYDSPETMKKWLELDGFKGVACMPPTIESQQGWCALRGGWPVKERGLKYNASILDAIFPFTFAYGASIEIDYNKSNRVVRVQFGYSVL
jgi:hypothetical protein